MLFAAVTIEDNGILAAAATAATAAAASIDSTWLLIFWFENLVTILEIEGDDDAIIIILKNVKNFTKT